MNVFLFLQRELVEVLPHSVVEHRGEIGPILGTVLDDKLLQNHVFVVCPLVFVAALFLNEQPTLLALFGVLRGHDLRQLIPVLGVKLLDIELVLDHVRKQAVLKQHGLVVLPLTLRPLALLGVLCLFQ